MKNWLLHHTWVSVLLSTVLPVVFPPIAPLVSAVAPFWIGGAALAAAGHQIGAGLAAKAATQDQANNAITNLAGALGPALAAMGGDPLRGPLPLDVIGGTVLSPGPPKVTMTSDGVIHIFPVTAPPKAGA